ncbi:MAG: alpha-mannosidase [Candidatus Hydrogenedentes bacterium]|nr:alpha-mannosidase [Candidatus Hydrogenedentota bacterium]
MSTTPPERTLHMIGHGHIDPTWLWRWTEGYEEVRATFRSALDRMRETPDFTFTASSPCFYAWIQESEPAMFEEIRARVAEGRWEIAGGMWIEPDCNIPCGESLVRHGLYGQRFFQRAFGKKAVIGFNPDTFGHPGNLPQILRGLGLNHYVFMRPMAVAERDYPGGTTFWWRAPDGSRVLTSNLGPDYNCWHSTRERMRSLPDNPQLNPGQTHILGFYGVGNHGGGPTKAAIADIEALRDEEGPLKPEFSTLERFFEAIARELDPATLHVADSELQYHARGCYSVHAGIKRWNRSAEHALMNAERLAMMAHVLESHAYPAETLSEAWRDLLYNHFHDIIAGTSVESSYEDARDQIGAARGRARAVINTAIQTIAREIDTTAAGNTIVVFNPLPWPVSQPVRVSGIVRRALDDPLHLVDDAGQPVPVQKVRGDILAEMPFAGDQSAFIAEVPGLGYRCYHARGGKSSARSGRILEATRECLENDWWRLELDPYGGHIARLYDKAAGVEVLREGLVLAALLDNSDTWSHGVKEFFVEAGRFGEARLRLVEHGDVLAMIEVTSRFGKSEAIAEISLFRDNPRIAVQMRVNWQESYHALKLGFETRITGGEATYETPYAATVRPATGYEEPGQQWFDLSGSIGETPYGLSILNSGQYGFDIKNDAMRVTLLRSPAYAHHDPVRYTADARQPIMDQGWHDFHLQLCPHAGGWRDVNAPRLAWEHNAPCIVHVESAHPGRLPARGGLLHCDAPNVILSVVKLPEEGAGLLVRGYETQGLATETTLRFPMLDRAYPAGFGPYTVKTWLIDPAAGSLREVNLLEEPA